MSKNKKEIFVGVIAISIAAILWGLDGVVLVPRLKDNSGGYLHIFYVVFALHFIPFILMSIFLFKEYKYLKQFSPKDFLLISLVAIFGGAVGTLAIVNALFLVQFNNLSIIVVLQKLQPVFGIALAAILLKERLHKHFFIWAAIAIVAGYFLTFGFHLPMADKNINTFYASLLSLLAAFSFGSSTVFSKMFLQKYNFSTATFYRYGITTIFMFVLLMISGTYMQFQVTPAKTWIIFLICAFTTGSGAIFLYYYGLKRVKAVVSTLSELFFPLSAILFDYFFNHNRLDAIQWISAAIMIFSIIKLSNLETKN